MVVYFTGTGNSKHIAERIAQKQQDDIIAAVDLIKAEGHPAFSSEKPYVFVAPTYAWRLPRVFKEWMQKCRFEGHQKAYFVLTCGGEIGAAAKDIKKFATEMGFSYMGTAEVVMPENYLIMFEPTKSEEDAAIVKAAEAHTDALSLQISEEIPFDEVKISLVGHLQSGIVNSSFYTFYVGAGKFYATSACISCGACVANCMLNNITLKDGKPIWGKDCTHCLACICKCPTAAIEYGKNTKGKRRYIFQEKE